MTITAFRGAALQKQGFELSPPTIRLSVRSSNRSLVLGTSRHFQLRTFVRGPSAERAARRRYFAMQAPPEFSE